MDGWMGSLYVVGTIWDMHLVLFTVSCVLFGSSSGKSETKSKCYGSRVKLPENYSPPLYKGPIYFTPKDGGPRKLMVNNGEGKDPRISVSPLSIYLNDLSKNDEGTFSVSFDEVSYFDVMTLEIMDCALEIPKLYGHPWEYDIPKRIEYLEFIPLMSPDVVTILWNHSDPQASAEHSGQAGGDVFIINFPKQSNSGYYNFRKKDKTVEPRILLKVQENVKYRDAKVNGVFIVEYPWRGGPWTVTFEPLYEKKRIVMREGILVGEDDWFSGRISDIKSGIEIRHVEARDSGVFEFRDPDGHLAMSMKIHLIHDRNDFFTYGAGVLGAVIPLLNVNQPAYPRHSDAQHSSTVPLQPAGYALSKEPKTTNLEPLVNPSADFGPPPAASSGSNSFLSSDTEQRFELKGLSSLSAPPLSSDTAGSDVYNSDKLNFL
ncbi:uncharacterized protein ACNS7B_012413 [Menidia menidia]